MLDLTRRETFHGPSPLAPEPVVTAELALGKLDIEQAQQIEAGLTAIAAPWLIEPPAREPERDDERLVAFLLRWTLSALTAGQGHLHASGWRRTGPRSFRIWIAFHVPAISHFALRLAVQLANDAVAGRLAPADAATPLQTLWRHCRQHHPDSSDEIAMIAATSMGIPWLGAWALPYHWQFGWGARSVVVSSAASNLDGMLAARIVAHKRHSKAVITRLGLPTPRHALVRDESEVQAALAHVGFPCVVKPVDGQSGKGVVVGLTSAEATCAAVRHARGFTRHGILIEAMAEGSDHRLMIVDGRHAGTFRREAPVVIGDGRRSIRTLVAAANQGRALPGVLAVRRRSRIELDSVATGYLAASGLTPDSVPEPGRPVPLRGNANLSTGGSCRDLSEETHPDVKAMAEALARTLDTHMLGIDYMTTDVSRSPRDVPGAFIELNLTPALAVLSHAGWSPVRIGKLVLGDRAGRIPLDIVVVPDAALDDAAQRLDRLPSPATWGWAAHDKAVAGGLALHIAERSPWAGMLALLSHRTIERGLLLVGSGLLQRLGLPVDRAERIWLCAADLPGDWRAVLAGASRAPLWEGAWEDLPLETAAGIVTQTRGA